MRMPTNCRILLVLPLLLLTAGTACAQDPYDWARKMFDSLDHDFGTVVPGTEVTHRFKVTNLYKEDMRIASVTTSCGCTAPRFDQTPVKSHQATYVEISMDTNKFRREKTSNVTITFDQPMFAQVVIPVKVYIRTDVTMTPNAINFGAVDAGKGQEQSLQLSYVGDPNWKITKVVTNNPYLTASVKETNRDNYSSVSYMVVVDLSPKAPVGNLRQQVLLMTNDQAAQIPLLVQARVESDVMVTPSVVQLGSVAPGAETVRTVLLRGRAPFVIDKVECESAHGVFKMPQLTRDAKLVHVIPLTFTAPKEAGSLSEKFIVTIAGRPEPVTFTAQGTIETAQQIVPR